MATHVVYSLRTGRIRRIVSDDERDDAYLIRTHKIVEGEARDITFPRGLDDIEEYQRELNRRTGIVPSNDRYASIDPLNDFQVVGAFILDPACGDSIRGRLLVADANADLEYRYLSDGSFQRCLPHIDHDIKIEQSKIARYSGDGWMDVEVNEKGTPSGQARQQRDALIAEGNAVIVVLEAERADRTAPRR